MDDAALVRRAREGDAAAFEQLVRRHSGAALAVALGVVHVRAEAEDVCQDAWLRALSRLETLRDPARFAVWLLQVVRSVAHNRRDYLQRRPAEPLADDANIAGAGDPGRDLARTLLRERLEGALAGLTEVQRQVVLLHDVEEWTHRAIAEALDLSEVASRQHLFQARRHLRRLLGETRTEDREHGT